MIRALWALMLAASLMLGQGKCNQPAPSPVVTIAMPGHPFGVLSSPDGCWLFVSLMGGTNGVAVLRREAGTVELARTIPFKSPIAGMAITHDGKVLIGAALDSVVLFDIARMTSGEGNPLLGSFNDGPESQSIYVNVTADDRLLFVSEEAGHAITVIDLARVRSKGYDPAAVIGTIQTGRAPIALTFSPDGRWLYTTSQGALPEWGWPAACKPERADPAIAPVKNPEGAVVVVDMERVRGDPAHAVVARVPAGCSPVRMAISSAGDRIYVTARNSNAVLAFETAKLVTDSAHARLAMTPVGTAPVPIAVVADSAKVIVGNSNRFGTSPGGGQTLSVLDAAKMTLRGTVPAGEFPREMSLSADGRTLFLTNFGSNSLQIMDVARLP
jgi:DNA-binding beta-propeller fold protein YncE